MLKSFSLRCETGKLCRGSLQLDVVTRWNLTYLMLISTLKLRVAFGKMEAEDKLYYEYFEEYEDEKKMTKRVGPPSTSDWDTIARLVNFMKIFYKCTLTFSSSQTVSSAICYNKIVDIERNLITKCGNADKAIRDEAKVIRDKFDKYWDGFGNMNTLLTVASVFDPRNKMKFASLCFDQLYGKDTIESRKLNALVSSVMTSLYEEDQPILCLILPTLSYQMMKMIVRECLHYLIKRLI
ncbi:putative ribonuclease H-like superfamily, hAT-like transposase, RNase-H [Arabidopsis thaliana]